MNGEPNWKRDGDVRTTGFRGHCAGIFSQNLSILRQIPPKTVMPSSFESFIEQKRCQPFFFFFSFLQRIASALQDRRFVWSGCGCLMPESVFVGFSFFPLFYGSLRLGYIWDTDEKGRGQNMASSCLKALSVSLGFHSVLSAQRKNGCVKFCCADFYRIGRSLFFSRCLAQGRRDSTICTLLATCSCLISMKEYWCGSHWAFSHSRGLLHAQSLSHWRQQTLKCDINM